MVLAADDSEDSHLHGDLLHLALFKWLHLFLPPQTDLSFSSAQSAGKVEGKEIRPQTASVHKGKKKPRGKKKQNPILKRKDLKFSPVLFWQMEPSSSQNSPSSAVSDTENPLRVLNPVQMRHNQPRHSVCGRRAGQWGWLREFSTFPAQDQPRGIPTTKKPNPQSRDEKHQPTTRKAEKQN